MVESLGSIHWLLNRKYHRENGPALENPSGGNYWYINGKRHRLDGPTVELVDSHKEWWVNGKLHRLDGPAIEYSDGRREWWINSIFCNKENFSQTVENFPSCEFKKLMEHIDNGYTPPCNEPVDEWTQNVGYGLGLAGFDVAYRVFIGDMEADILLGDIDNTIVINAVKSRAVYSNSFFSFDIFEEDFSNKTESIVAHISELIKSISSDV